MPPSISPPFAVRPLPFEFAVVGMGPLRVLAFQGEEGISKLFRFDVEVAAAPGVDLTQEAELLGASAQLTFKSARPRIVHGCVARVTALDATVEAGKCRVFRVRLVPPIWLSKHRVASRVFQDKTIPTLAADRPGVVESLRAMSVGTQPPDPEQDIVFQVADDYQPREYCVQYRESDWAFTKRIAAEEGLMFYFEHSDDPNGRPKMVFIDRAQAYPALAPLPTVEYSARALDNANATSKGVERFEFVHVVRPNDVLLTDYDSTRPMLEVQAASEVGRAKLALQEAKVPVLQAWEHEGDFAEPTLTPRLANVRLEQLRRRAKVNRGQSAEQSLMPGYRFKVVRREEPDVAVEHVVTKLRHEMRLPYYGGNPQQVYENFFECVEATVAHRPKAPKLVPRQVLEPAVVTGPADGTVYTDAYGRIRVQLLWDKGGLHDEHSATWLRVIQGWAGAAYGWQFIPRVGMEVMVSFLGGDPDRPVVVGALYNGARPAPFHLPQQRTRSGIRTESTPGGQGYNELSFEDASGSEQIYLRAQRDLDEDVTRNHSLTVKRSQLVVVGDAQSNRVGGNQDEVVAGAATRVVNNDETVDVKGNRVAAVGGSETTTIDQERRVRVGTHERSEVVGTANWTIGDDLTVRTAGCHTTLVGTADARRSYVLHVEGTTDLVGRELTEIRSDEGIRLRCGESVVAITPEHIELVSPKLSLRSPDASVVVDGDKLALHAKADAVVKSGDTVLVASLGASLSLQSEVKASGSRILLNAPDFAQDPARAEPPPPTTIDVVDARGKPLPYSRCVVVLGDGSERSYFTDEDGRVTLDDLDEAAHIRLVGLVDASYG